MLLTILLQTINFQTLLFQFITDEDFGLAVESSDDEEGTPIPEKPWVNGRLKGISEIHAYSSCRNSRCFHKKLRDNKCPKCEITYRGDTPPTGMSATLITTRTADKKDERLIAFRNHLEHIWSRVSPDNFPSNDTQAIVDKLLEEEITIDYQYNYSNIITAIKMKNKMHPE